MVTDANKAALELFRADSKAPLLTSVAETLGPWTMEAFKKELCALCRESTASAPNPSIERCVANTSR